MTATSQNFVLFIDDSNFTLENFTVSNFSYKNYKAEKYRCQIFARKNVTAKRQLLKHLDRTLYILLNFQFLNIVVVINENINIV